MHKVCSRAVNSCESRSIREDGANSTAVNGETVTVDHQGLRRWHGVRSQHKTRQKPRLYYGSMGKIFAASIVFVVVGFLVGNNWIAGLAASSAISAAIVFWGDREHS